jgi:acyl-CoA dehydrogenase
MTNDPFSTDERRALAALTADFTAKEIAPNLNEWEDAELIPREVHKALGDAGLLGIGYPEEVGGSGGDSIDVTVLTENLLSSGGSGGAFASLFSHGIAIPHIIDAANRRRVSGDDAGADWLLDEYIRPVLAGDKIAALGVTEPDGGSDVAHLRTRAIPDGDDWIINGAKTYITSGVRADVVVVAARTGEEGASGVSLFAVDTSLPGFTVTRKLQKMGWDCSDTAELAFVDLRVPSQALLTPEPGGGFASLSRHFAVERLSLATLAYATAQRCIDLTVEWTRQRETFGRPLLSRQVVRHDLVEMIRRTDVARVYARSVAIRHAAGEPVLLEAVLAKNTAVEACDWVVDRAVQLHGGVGYMRHTEVERHYRDSRIIGIGGGATEVMTDLAAKLLGW